MQIFFRKPPRKTTHSGENGSSAYNYTLGFDELELKNIETDSVN